jgi:hypothetical protein
LTKRLGRFTLSGDDIMSWFLDILAKIPSGAAVPVEIVTLILRAADGGAHFIPSGEAVAMRRAIRQGWRPSTTLTPPDSSARQLEPKGSLS